MTQTSRPFHVDFSNLQDADTLTPVARALWRREVSYWTYLMEGDYDAYMELWHPEFAGWPSACERPGGVEPVREIARHYIWMLSSRPELTLRPYIVTDGRHPTTFYRFEMIGNDPRGARLDHSGRILHVWEQEAGQWRIIVGASGVSWSAPAAAQTSNGEAP